MASEVPAIFIPSPRVRCRSQSEVLGGASTGKKTVGLQIYTRLSVVPVRRWNVVVHMKRSRDDTLGDAIPPHI